MDVATIDYYDKYAEEYAENTKYANLHDIRTVFLSMIDPDARIADIGCGGGRDMKIFGELGYTVDGIDASRKMCEVASEYTGEIVKCQDINEWSPMYAYGGIWASASLLHLKENEFFDFFIRIKRFLKNGGVIYFSMKSEIDDGYDSDGRYYIGFNKNKLAKILTDNPEYGIVRHWKTQDALKRNLIWENVILKLNWSAD